MAAHGQGDKESVLVSLGCLVQVQSYSNKTKRKQKEQQRNISKTWFTRWMKMQEAK